MIKFNTLFLADVPALAGKSVLEMCKHADLNPTSYYRALKGSRVRLSAILAIANACEVDPQAFFFNDDEEMPSTHEIYKSFHRLHLFAFAFASSTTIKGTNIKWQKAFRAEDGYQHGRISRMLSPEASSMYPEDLCYACNTNGLRPSVFFTEILQEEEASKARLLDRLDSLMREVNLLKAQL